MQKENTSFFLPAIGGIILLLLIGAGLMYFGQKKQERNWVVNNQQVVDTTSTTSAQELSSEKKADEIFLTITQPIDKTTITSPNLVISGKTVANAEVSINDQTIPANANGDFSAQVSLEEGDNYFYIVANDADGFAAEKEIMVTYESQLP